MSQKTLLMRLCMDPDISASCGNKQAYAVPDSMSPDSTASALDEQGCRTALRLLLDISVLAMSSQAYMMNQQAWLGSFDHVRIDICRNV